MFVKQQVGHGGGVGACMRPRPLGRELGAPAMKDTSHRLELCKPGLDSTPQHAPPLEQEGLELNATHMLRYFV